jgi:cysteine-rich repeat protein
MSSLRHLHPLAVLAVSIGLISCDQAFSLERPPSCGDGVLAQDENCDDGAAEAGDGCGSTCEIEPGFECPSMNVGQPCLPVVGLSRGPAITELPAAGSMGNNAIAFECEPGEVMIGLEGYANEVGDNLGRISFVCAALALGENGEALLTTASRSVLFGTSQSGPFDSALCAADEVVTGFVPTTNTYVSGVELTCQKLFHTGGELRIGSTTPVLFGPTEGMQEAARQCPPNEVLTRAFGTIGSSLDWLGFACSAISAVVCGDGAVVTPETCDDGNLIRHDGCDDRCLLE